MPTSPRKIETPSGPKTGSIFEKMQVLGISSFFTQTGNQPNHPRQWEEIVDIPVPVGTEAIVASQDYWLLAFGSLDSPFDPLDARSNPGWNNTDHNLGLGRASVSIVDINAPNLTVSPPTQTSKIIVRMNLLDENGDDPWFGILGYTLTFLGATRPNVIVVGTDTSEKQPRIKWH